MKKGLWIYLIVLVVLVSVLAVVILKNINLPPATLQNFTTSRDVFVSGEVTKMDVTTAAKGYYRLKLENSVIEGEHLTGNIFSKDMGDVPSGHWVTEDGGNISYTITSSTPVSVTLKAGVDEYATTIFVLILVGCLLFLLAVVMFQ